MRPHGALIVEIHAAITARAAGMTGGRTKPRDAVALDQAFPRLGTRDVAMSEGWTLGVG